MRRLLRLVTRLVFLLGAIMVGLVVAYRFVPPPLTPLMVIRMVEAGAGGRGVGVVRRWVGLERVSPALVRAVIAAEDARFFLHHGIDVAAAREAQRFNATHGGHRVRGASTITMQCARNVFLWPGRTWTRKGLEAVLAVLLEVGWGKRRIVEIYLNVVEWGDGLYGAEAAAERYFGVPAIQLNDHEAALLAAALPSPRRSNPAAPSAYLRARAAVIESRARSVTLSPLGDVWRGSPSRQSPNTRSALPWRKSASVSASSASDARSSRQTCAGQAGWFEPKSTFRRPWPRRYATSSGG